MSTTLTSREIRLAARPTGEPTAETFALETVHVGEPGPGEVLVRNTFMSVEPYMRGRMNDAKSYVPPFQVGEPLSGAAVGEVVASNVEGIEPGMTVLHDRGWREYAIVPAGNARPIDASRTPAETFLGALGVPGFTSWAGLRIVANVQPGQTLFVSGAAGAVGSMTVQLAKRIGLRVIGSASSPEKAAYVRDTLGADEAFDYHDGAYKALKRLAPDGIDVYFDNVGGEQLEAAIGHMNTHGTVVLCGAISGYNAAEAAPGPRNLSIAIGRRLRLQGFIITDHYDRLGDFINEVAPLVGAGEIESRSHYFEGIENAPEAMMTILRPNASIGKIVVRL